MSGFERDQRSYYLNEINRALPTTGPIDQRALERALQVSDTMGPRQGGTPGEMGSLLSTYSMNSDALQKDAACRARTSPAGMRTPSDRTGCGWWFVPNPTTTSSGAYGTKRGPMATTLDTTYGSGQWIWDPTEAAQREGMKQAARVQACPDIQYVTYPNIGWCPGTNMALVTDGYGNPAYPQAAGGDCPGGGIVTSAASCPPPPPPPGAPPGFVPQQVPGSIAGECSTTPLTPSCYQAMLPYAGCSPNGALGLALSTGSYPGQYQPFNDANTAMVQRGFTMDSTVINTGNTSMNTAFETLAELRYEAAAGKRDAQNACFDATIDFCPGPSDTQTAASPFLMSCIRKAAIAMGYPAAAPILQDTMASYWAQTQYYPNWQSVMTGLAYWMEDARQAGPAGLYDVYGINVTVPPLPYLAVDTQFAMRPSLTPGNHIIFNPTNGWVVQPDSPDRLLVAINNAAAGNLAGSARSLYTPNMISISTFKISPGNNGVANYISIQSTQYPGYFMRQSNYQLWMMQNPGADEQFNSDSSFQIIPQGNGSVAFQSYNYPDRYITAGDSNEQLVVIPTANDGHAVFLVTAPLQ